MISSVKSISVRGLHACRRIRRENSCMDIALELDHASICCKSSPTIGNATSWLKKIVEGAKQHTPTLGGSAEAGRRAVAELCASGKAGKEGADCTLMCTRRRDISSLMGFVRASSGSIQFLDETP